MHQHAFHGPWLQAAEQWCERAVFDYDDGVATTAASSREQCGLAVFERGAEIAVHRDVHPHAAQQLVAEPNEALPPDGWGGGQEESTEPNAARPDQRLAHRGKLRMQSCPGEIAERPPRRKRNVHAEPGLRRGLKERLEVSAVAGADVVDAALHDEQ